MPDPTATRSRPPLWRDVRALRVAFQVAVLAAVVGLLWYLFDNLRANDVELDFGFLDQQSGFPIAYTDHGPSDTVRDVVRTAVSELAPEVVAVEFVAEPAGPALLQIGVRPPSSVAGS